MDEKNSGDNTIKRKKLIYSLIITVCALLLIAATVLTVYFVTANHNEVLENPEEPVEPADPVEPNEPDEPTGPVEPDGPTEPSNPTGGEDTVIFVSPLESAVCSVEYGAIYTNESRAGMIYRHYGVDFAAEEGASVCAIAAGTVTSVSYSDVLGNVITLDHGDGLVSYYRFVEPVDGLKEGDTVAKGALIATVAAAYGTEYRDGTHLHLEIKLNEASVDPADYFDITYEEK